MRRLWTIQFCKKSGYHSFHYSSAIADSTSPRGKAVELKLWDPLAHIQRQKIPKFQLIPTIRENGTVGRPKLEFQHGGSRGQNSSFGRRNLSFDSSLGWS
jgi:hypothetical protein